MEQQKEKIGGVTFQVTPFGAMEALKLKAWIVRLLAPTLAEVLKGSSSGDIKKASDVMNMDLANVDLAGSVEKLFEILDEDTLESLIKRLFSRTSVIIGGSGSKKKIFALGSAEHFDSAFDAAFKQNLKNMYKAIFFVLKVNYPDFLAIFGVSGDQETASSNEQNDE